MELSLERWFSRLTALLARFIGRPLMLIICLLLAAGSVMAYVSRSELLINGSNLAINVLTLLFLPVLQATQTGMARPSRPSSTS